MSYKLYGGAKGGGKNFNSKYSFFVHPDQAAAAAEIMGIQNVTTNEYCPPDKAYLLKQYGKEWGTAKWEEGTWDSVVIDEVSPISDTQWAQWKWNIQNPPLTAEVVFPVPAYPKPTDLPVIRFKDKFHTLINPPIAACFEEFETAEALSRQDAATAIVKFDLMWCKACHQWAKEHYQC